MARSIDRNPPCRSGAGDLERIRRGPADRCAVEQHQRPHRTTRRARPLRAGPDRQFRVTVHDRTIVGVRLLAQFPNLPQQLTSTQVIVRFCLRMIILVFFATLSSIGFSRSLAALLWMSTILSAVIGVMRREPPFDNVLNHWDETEAYAALCCLGSGFNQAALS